MEDGILYKGEFDVTNATEIADHVKSATDMDITVFYGDTRYMSSVVNEQGERIIGTTAQEVVIDKVLNVCFFMGPSGKIGFTFQMMLT